MASLLTFWYTIPRHGTFPAPGLGAKLFSGEINLVADRLKCPVLADRCRFD